MTYTRKRIFFSNVKVQCFPVEASFIKRIETQQKSQQKELQKKRILAKNQQHCQS